MADLSYLNTVDKSEEGVWMPVLDLDGNPLDTEILLLGPDSMEATKIANEVQKDVYKRIAESAGKGAKNVQEEDLVGEQIDQAVRITKGWKNLQWDGPELPFNHANAVMLYTQSPIIREQALRFYRDRSNFTKSGSKNSKKR